MQVSKGVGLYLRTLRFFHAFEVVSCCKAVSCYCGSLEGLPRTPALHDKYILTVCLRPVRCPMLP